MNTNHTPTPWIADASPGRIEICNEETLFTVAVINQSLKGPGRKLGEDDAAFIVRACNSHDALVAALEVAALRYLNNPDIAHPYERAELSQIYAALALAKGEQ